MKIKVNKKRTYTDDRCADLSDVNVCDLLVPQYPRPWRVSFFWDANMSYYKKENQKPLRLYEIRASNGNLIIDRCGMPELLCLIVESVNKKEVGVKKGSKDRSCEMDEMMPPKKKGGKSKPPKGKKK